MLKWNRLKSLKNVKVKAEVEAKIDVKGYLRE